MNAFDNTATETFKNTAYNAWGPGINYDARIGKVIRRSRNWERKVFQNTGLNVQPYMTPGESYLETKQQTPDKTIHDNLAINYGISIPHALLEKPYVGFSDPNYKKMKNRKPQVRHEPNPLQALGGTITVPPGETLPDAIIQEKIVGGSIEDDEVKPINEIIGRSVKRRIGKWISRFNQNCWQPVGVSIVTPATWVAKHDDNYWEPVPYSPDWDAENNRWIIGSVDASALRVTGIWAVDYRPDLVRVTMPGGNTVRLFDDDANDIYLNESYTSEEEGSCTFYGTAEINNIHFLTVLFDNYPGYVNNIEFGTAEVSNIAWDSTNNQWTFTESEEIKVHDQSNWARNFQPKAIKLKIYGDGTEGTYSLKDAGSKVICTKTITPANGSVSVHTANLNWHGRADIDTLALTITGTWSIRDIEFLAYI